MIFKILIFVLFVTTNGEYQWKILTDDEGGVHLVNLAAKPVVINSVKENITILLNTRLNPDEPQVVQINETETIGNFNNTWLTVIVAHGWRGDRNSLRHITNAWLNKSECNIFTIDWKALAADANYVNVKATVVPVAEVVAELIDWLTSTFNLDVQNLHLVGHSLGAHVVGNTGSRIKLGKPAIISGLDPALPLYEDEVPEMMLDRTDGQFVQVVHSCIDFLGISVPIGTADFYPNGGIHPQPGCGLDFTGSCSHSRAHLFFAESITSTVGFIGYLCSNWTLYDQCHGNPWSFMGEPVNRSASGSFFLTTADESPFALGFVGR